MKPTRKMRGLLCLLTFAAGLLLYLGVTRPAARNTATELRVPAPAAARLDALPHVILWAWERPEKLEFIDPEKIGVAFLGRTLHLSGEKVLVRPRLQPLNVPDGMPLIAVARIESDRDGSATLSLPQTENAAAAIVELARLPNVVAIQIDFDARVSERKFYFDLLTKVRGTLPPATALTITALASWCQGDNWLDQLPIDEAVPMLFRMGTDRSSILNSLATGESFRSSLCRQSSGVSVDETLPFKPATERIYVFNPNSWSQNSVKTVLERYQR